jgi:hypothetical protein
MADVKQTRHRFVVLLVVLGCICLAAAGILLSPIGNASQAGPQQIRSLRVELATRMAEVKPLDGIEGKIVSARQEVADFSEHRLPTSYADISDTLGKLAAQTGVTLATGQYKSEPVELDAMNRITITASVLGSYTSNVRFINAVEREKTLFLINDVSLGGQQGNNVSLQIAMETYLRPPQAVKTVSK